MKKKLNAGWMVVLSAATALGISSSAFAETATAARASTTSAQAAQSSSNPSNLNGSDTFTQDEILKVIPQLMSEMPELMKEIPQLAKGGEQLAQDADEWISKAIKTFGYPNGIIVGGEEQGAFGLGYRQGSGKALFKGQSLSDAQEIYWRSLSIGINAGANAGGVLVLVYGARSPQEMMGDYGAAGISTYGGVGGSLNFLDNFAGVKLGYIAVGVGLSGGVRIEGMNFSDSEAGNLFHL